MGEISLPFPDSEGTIGATVLFFLHALAAQSHGSLLIVRLEILNKNIRAQSSLL
jgi:hypothetical protein